MNVFRDRGVFESLMLVKIMEKIRQLQENQRFTYLTPRSDQVKERTRDVHVQGLI